MAVIAIDEEDHVYLVGQYRYTLDAYSWELPMGGAPLDVDPLTAAQRELREEAGLVARDWRPLLTLHTSNSVTDEIGFVYVAERLTPGEQELEETEELEIARVPFTEAVAFASDGRITDALSVAALLKLALERSARDTLRGPAHERADASLDARS